MKNVLMIHMQDQFEALAPLLQQAHTGHKKLSGMAQVSQGNFLARIICSVFRFPKPTEQVDLQVECIHTEDSMHWKRNFGGLKMESRFTRQGEYLIEHLGPLAMAFKAEVRNSELHYQFVKTKMFSIPLPNFLSPQVIAYEKQVDEEYCFYVAVNMFLIGMTISYHGNLLVNDYSGDDQGG